METATWHDNNIFTIKITGKCEWVRKMVANLERDFNEPKFGYNGELWDEYEYEN